MGGMFSEKSDGCSFGFLQLEIISGKKNTNFYSSDQHIGFLAYAWHLWNEGRGLELVDEVLADSYSPSKSHGFLFLKPKDIAYAWVKFQIGKHMELYTIILDFCLSLASIPNSQNVSGDKGNQGPRKELSKRCNSPHKTLVWGLGGFLFVRLLGVEAMMPSLQDPERFNLWGAKVNRDGLVTLMLGCKDLVMLDAKDCSGFEENDDEISKIASHISQFMCEGYEFPECLCGMDNFVLHVDGYSFHLHVEETWDEMLNDLRNAFNDLGDEE
ncbi:unnamed protein product [Prunus armeniaca]